PTANESRGRRRRSYCRPPQWACRCLRCIFPSVEYALGRAPRGHLSKNLFCRSAPTLIDRILSGRSSTRTLTLMLNELAEWRRWYAEDLKLRAPVRRRMVIIEAFASVPRERFLGPGPWRLLPGDCPDAGFLTPDDPRWLYHDTLVTIDQSRGLNNGLPSLWA